MQQLIDQLARERREHLQRIENVTLKDIKKLVSSPPVLENVFIESKELRASPEDQERTGTRVRVQELMVWGRMQKFVL